MEKSDIKIKPTETVIDSNWCIETNHLTREEAEEASHRIYLLANNYMKEVFVNYREVLYQDLDDHRYWELTYPYSYYPGEGPPVLKYLTDEEAEAKYKISPKYIPELKPKPEETVFDFRESFSGLTRMESQKVSFRLGWLIQYYLKKVITVSDENILYRDPGDNRYWELTYRNTHIEGYRTALLKYIPDEEAKAKYKI